MGLPFRACPAISAHSRALPQEMSLAAVQQAERTQSGIIRLSESGLAAVGHEAALLEVRAAAVPGQTHQRDAFGWPRRAVRLAQRLRSVGSFQAAALTVRLASACAWGGWLAGALQLSSRNACCLHAQRGRQLGHCPSCSGLQALKVKGAADEVVEPDMLDPAMAAEVLAGYCCGLSHATAELAVMGRGEEASTVEQRMQVRRAARCVQPICTAWKRCLWPRPMAPPPSKGASRRAVAE